MRKATETDQHAVFLFSDTQIKQESFLEDINNLLNTGEVPNLFPLDEKQEICEKMRQLDRWLNRLGNLTEYFNLTDFEVFSLFER